MRCVECDVRWGPDETPIICTDCRPGHPLRRPGEPRRDRGP